MTWSDWQSVDSSKSNWLKLCEVSPTCTGTWYFYILSRSWMSHDLFCKHSSNSKLTCSSMRFHKKSPDVHVCYKRIILQMNGVSFWLHCRFPILIMTMKTPEDFQTLWTEHFAWNDLNSLYGTKCFENETDCLWMKQNTFWLEWNILRTKQNVLVTERNALRTERFWDVHVVLRLRICITKKPLAFGIETFHKIIEAGNFKVNNCYIYQVPRP